MIRPLPGFLVAVLLISSLAPGALADDPPQQGPPKAQPKAPLQPVVPGGDFRAALGVIQRAVEEMKEKPAEPGIYDRREDTWKHYAKPRASRMVSRLKRLARESLWTLEGPADAEVAIALETDAWGPFVRTLASLYTELGTIMARYDDVKIDGKHAWKVWLHANPKPDPIGPTASEPDLAAITAVIARYIRQGNPVPPSYYTERNRLAALVAEEQRIAREQKRAEYEARKHQAREAIDARVAHTKSLLDSDVEGMSDQQRGLQVILAAAQVIEEGALRKRVETLQAEGKPVEDADALLAKMAKSRKLGQTFRDERSSRFGSLIRQGWMVPRAKLLKAIDRAAHPDDK